MDEEDAGLGDLVVFGAVKFFTQALIAPFHVAKILQQVNYIPCDDFVVRVQHRLESLPTQGDGDGDDDNSGSPADGADSSNGDASSTGDGDNVSELADSIYAQATAPAVVTGPGSAIVVDEQGYLVRTTFSLSDPVRPQYQLPPQDGSLFDTLSNIWRQPDEGLMSMWKGHVAHWLREMMELVVQPTLEGSLNDMLGLPDESIPLIHLDRPLPNVFTLLASRVVTGVLLSPLELVRTRLIVQTVSPSSRKYNNTFHALWTIRHEEGISVFFTGTNLYASILLHTSKSIFKHCSELFIERGLGLKSEERPFLYNLCELLWNLSDLLITLPIETVRRRLQCQIDPGVRQEREFRTLVELRQAPYSGVLDCAQRLVDEEGGKRSARRRKSVADVASQAALERSWYYGWGTKRLFVSIRAQAWVDLAMFFVTSLSNLQDNLES
ncbi:mitochondrial carrier [Gonapodya prolifera JEL478]|uniref:Mitochondrial carrier n=1 Tax=Gonapodya prolifera (strain JEL478) TaxID=1344416 RepID=A0A139ASZ8_GONPJ|nr:mitochondrial carrier [Gonapodya prolifera JEL478]|eukprot:KXS19861.1 mitochondrial carrier [Gonapodya prolifera JEL478]